MKKLLTIISVILIFGITANAQNLFSAGICHTSTPPNFNPGAKGCRVVLDTTSQIFYTWKIGTVWDAMGSVIDETLGCGVPLYTPTKWQSNLIINQCSPPKIYKHVGAGVWGEVLGGSTYTAGTGIAISGGNVISNTGDLSTTNELNSAFGINSTNLRITDAGGNLDVPLVSIAPVQSVTAADFDLTAGVLALDYTSAQKATALVPGFLTAADWTTFNAKLSVEVDGDPANELQTIANTSDATSHTQTLSNSGGSTQYIEGTGIGLATGGTSLNGTVTLTNTLPDQTVVLNNGTGISATGAYPNFTITNTAPSLWTDGGATTYLTATTDNVSIGTTTANSTLDVTVNSLGVTPANASGLVLSNNTAAAAGAQQISPGLRWRAQGWKTTATAASQTVDFRADVLPIQGTTAPTATWQLGASINGGAYINGIYVRSDGHVSCGGVGSITPTYSFNVNNTTDQIAAVIGNFNFNNAVNGGAGTGMGIAAFSSNSYLYNTNGAISLKTNTGFGVEQERLKADASGYISVGSGNAKGAAWGLNGIVFRAEASSCGSVDNTTAASATVTNNVANSFAIPAFAATNASITYTNAANVYIAGAATTSSGCGLNTPTLTNTYAMWVDAGVTRLDGKVMVNSTGTPTDFLEVTGNIALTTAGNKLKIATGSNASIGTATLVGGTVTVSTTAVATASKIFVSVDTPGGTIGFISAPSASIVNATSFVINSSSVLDTSSINWWIVN